MDLIQKPVEFLFHFDKYLTAVIQYCGAWTYLVLFAVIFAETGFVVTPFLPGDSLLFVLGTFSALGAFNPILLALILMLAAISGDSINYAIGKYFGMRIVHSKRIPFFNKEHLDKTHRFYEKYGAKTIVLARFIPVVRTVAPFVAGLAKMDYKTFFTYNVAGGVAWISIFVSGGYYFGNIPFVKKHFSVVVMLIIFLSILPAVIEFLKAKSKVRHHESENRP